MSFDRHVIYSARCDIRTDSARDQVMFTKAAYDAWHDAGEPTDGSLWEALGFLCGAKPPDVYANSAADARKELEAKGWAFKYRGKVAGVAMWKAACPDHRTMV